MNAVEKTTKAPRRRGRKGKSSPGTESTSSFQENGQNENQTITYRPHKTLLVHLTEETPTWHECGRNTPFRDDTIFSINKASSNGNKKTRYNPSHLITKYRDLADSIYKQEVAIFRTASSDNRDKDEQWVENTMKKGTLKDRIAAMSVVISSHPLHKIYALDMLLNLVGISSGSNAGNTNHTNQRVGQMGSEALTDLFVNTLLPPNRKLIGLEARPLFLFDDFVESSQAKQHISPRILLLWRYEEIIKSKYSAFLSQYLGKTLLQTATSSLDSTKTMALKTACSLLKDTPEGEAALLSMVVDKIGDPLKKIAAAAAHELRGVLDTHPNMITVVAREVQQLAYRPNLSSKALYNCIIFLNQLKLAKDEDDISNAENQKNQSDSKSSNQSLPASLINTYFQLFEVTVNKTKSTSKKKSKDVSAAMKSRLLGALLTGVNRAHPYLPKKDTAMEKHIDSLYRIAHISPPSVCTQALMLLFHLAVGSGSDEDDVKTSNNGEKGAATSSRKDRFYRALYSKIGDTSMFTGKQLTLFFNLIYKAMKNDTNGTRVVAFGKRLLHTAFHHGPSVVSGVLFLLSEVTKHQPSLQTSAFESAGHSTVFDPLKREPTAAFGTSTSNSENEGENDPGVIQNASLWELALTVHHYHPTVSKFSSSISEISYNGDPLRDFTLAPFLDKFAFRNPKSMKNIGKQLKRGESIGERKSGLQAGIKAMTSLPVNDPDFWKKQKKNGDERDEFFQKFFLERNKRDELKGIVRGKTTGEAEAFNNAEKEEVDFDWDSDPEEEDFVKNLAEKLMETSGNGKANFDDEDPDMDDWSDVDDDVDDDEIEGNEADFAAFDGLSSDDDDARSDLEFDAENGEAEEMNPFQDADDDVGMISTGFGGKNKKAQMSSFADAEEYEEVIAAAQSKNAKRSSEEEETPEPSKKRRKKRAKR